VSDDKRSECLKVYVSEPLELELRRLADGEDRKLSDYIAIVLRWWAFGHAASRPGDVQGPDRPD